MKTNNTYKKYALISLLVISFALISLFLVEKICLDSSLYLKILLIASSFLHGFLYAYILDIFDNIDNETDELLITLKIDSIKCKNEYHFRHMHFNNKLFKLKASGIYFEDMIIFYLKDLSNKKDMNKIIEYLKRYNIDYYFNETTSYFHFSVKEDNLILLNIK